MKIMKKLLSAAMAVAMLATSTAAFAWHEGYEPLGTETLTTTLFTTEEAIELYADDAAVAGVNIALTGTREEAISFNCNIKIPTGFSLCVNTGTAKKPVWEYIELTKENFQTYLIDWGILGDAAVDMVQATNKDGDDYFGIQIQVFSETFNPSENFIQIFLCDEDGEYTLPEDAFEVTMSTMGYYVKDNAFDVSIVNVREGSEEGPTAPVVAETATTGTERTWDVTVYENDLAASSMKAVLTNESQNDTQEVTLTWVDGFMVEGSGSAMFKLIANVSEAAASDVISLTITTDTLSNN